MSSATAALAAGEWGIVPPRPSDADLTEGARQSAQVDGDVQTRILVVDDDTVIREGLSFLLQAGSVVGAHPDIDALLSTRQVADVVLIDLALRGTSTGEVLQGVEGVSRVVQEGYRALVYTNERRREVLACAVARGASGVVHKAESIRTLRHALDVVADGGVWITQALTGLAELVERRGQLPALSPRQREVLAGRARGEPFTRLARRLGISVRTAEEHMAVVNLRFADYLRGHSAADLERLLGLDPPGLVD